MKMRDECLPCLINQVIKVAKMTNVKDTHKFYQKIFLYLSEMNFQQTNPEVIGATFQLLKQHIGNDDPYYQIRQDYNKMFFRKLCYFEEKINTSSTPFVEAIKYAIMGNIIDFNPLYNHDISDVMKYFEKLGQCQLTIDHSKQCIQDLKQAKTLLYLGDNCGEICLDLLLIKKIKELNPSIHIYFGVRGAAVVNDSIEEDAYFVGMDKYADIISNGDSSLGTILSRTSEAFQNVYYNSDIIIAKGQGNYESLSEEKNQNIYFLLMSKCDVIAKDIGVKRKSLICLNTKYKEILYND
jgi:Uncharacterized conserved protein